MDAHEKMVRTFIAFGIEQRVLDKMVQVQEELKRAMARDFRVKWTPPEAMHLTLVIPRCRHSSQGRDISGRRGGRAF